MWGSKKHPLQNRTNVQIKGGGVKGLLNNVQKTCTFLKGGLPLFVQYFWVTKQEKSTLWEDGSGDDGGWL